MVELAILTFSHSIPGNAFKYFQLLRDLIIDEFVFQGSSHIHNPPLFPSSSSIRMRRIQYNNCCDLLTPLFVGDTNHCSLRYLWQREELSFDLERRDFLATRFDDVNAFSPTDKVHRALGPILIAFACTIYIPSGGDIARLEP